MTIVHQIAAFVQRSRYEDLGSQVRDRLKSCVLDALGCALGALEGEPVRVIREHLAEFGGAPICSLIGGGRTSPDHAALYNSSLVRYLDFNDSFLAPGETCHPSDSLGGVLAAAEYAGLGGRDFLTALAVAYQVQCRLSEAAPVRDRGFDHTVQGAYGAAAGVSKALKLDVGRTAHALAIAGTAYNALRVTRTGALSNWKGLASPHAVAGATQAVFLARRGITGPLEVFEGTKGFMESFGRPFLLDWTEEGFQCIPKVVLKKFNAEIHSQAALEAALALRDQEGFAGADVERVEIRIFDVAHDIIGGGNGGAKTTVRTKEEADHSLPYMIAVAFLDGQVTPGQYTPARIGRSDVQDLLRRIDVQPWPEYSEVFPAEMRCRISVHLRDGRELAREQRGYEGFHLEPMSWETVVRKFESVSERFVEGALRTQIIEAVAGLESAPVSELMKLLARVPAPAGPAVRADSVRPDSTSTRVSASWRTDAPAAGERAFSFLRLNGRPDKPRLRGVTEIRGPYYTPMGPRYLQDVLETMSDYVDSLKFAGGSFALLPRRELRDLLDLCHAHGVLVSTGGFIERVLSMGVESVHRYIEECREVGFDIIEVSSGFITIPTDDWLRLIEAVQRAGLKAKPEVGIQFGAGGATSTAELEAEGTRSPDWAIAQARRFIEAGVYMIMIESEGITENVRAWRTDVVARFIDACGLEKLMFEAADPEVFGWYVKNYGPEVNLFVDHSQIVQLECLRSGLWGTKGLWGRVLTYKQQ